MKKYLTSATLASPYFWIAVVIVLIIIVVSFRKIKDKVSSIWGDTKGSSDKRYEQQSQSEENTLQNLGMKPSYFESWYEAAANTIHDSLKYIGDSNSDEETAKNILMRLNNDLDVAKLITAFGKRCETFFWICSDGEKSLLVFVRGSLEPWRIKQVNENWASEGKKITYRL